MSRSSLLPYSLEMSISQKYELSSPSVPPASAFHCTGVTGMATLIFLCGVQALNSQLHAGAASVLTH